MRRQINAAFFNNNVIWAEKQGSHIIDLVFGSDRRKTLTKLANFYPEIITSENFENHTAILHDLEIIFSTWEMPVLTSEQIAQMKNLKAVFYAAGATQYFREPFIKEGVIVCSATAANAVPVAEFALAQILLAGAGYFRNSRECIDYWHTLQANNHKGCGNYGNRVSILGSGTISTVLQEFLKSHALDVVIIPSRKYNRTISLEEAFATSFAIVNLFPDRDDNVGILNAPLFRSMINSAVFINVGRGRQINEADLIAVMEERPDLTALLDVQYPEPPANGSKLYILPNIQLSGHIAGAKNSELIRMADYMIEDFIRFIKKEPLKYQVQPYQL
ncbi:MAG: NAD(P)-dependent oxidoreductase [Kiritimatiellales bacterium]